MPAGYPARRRGSPEDLVPGPYRAIVVAAASPRIPPPLIEQLTRLTRAYFVPLVGAHGIPSREGRDEP